MIGSKERMQTWLIVLYYPHDLDNKVKGGGVLVRYLSLWRGFMVRYISPGWGRGHGQIYITGVGGGGGGSSQVIIAK